MAQDRVQVRWVEGIETQVGSPKVQCSRRRAGVDENATEERVGKVRVESKCFLVLCKCSVVLAHPQQGPAEIGARQGQVRVEADSLCSQVVTSLQKARLAAVLIG